MLVCAVQREKEAETDYYISRSCCSYGFFLMERGDFSAADMFFSIAAELSAFIPVYGKALEKSFYSQLCLGQSMLFRKLSQLNAARKECQKAIQMDPTNVGAALMFCSLLQNFHSRHEALGMILDELRETGRVSVEKLPAYMHQKDEDAEQTVDLLLQ